jgi:2-keto-4-pentenoate hydratase/2-oxohepta-3-ene-1,7-dioic acid hydratase in catechol pathway
MLLKSRVCSEVSQLAEFLLGGAGFSPPRWLQPGDVVRTEVTGLGAIEQRIVA